MGHFAAVWDQRASIEITKDWNGIDQVTLRSPRSASARVSLHGGQVISWRSDRGEELLFTSSKDIEKEKRRQENPEAMEEDDIDNVPEIKAAQFEESMKFAHRSVSDDDIRMI